MSRISPIRRRRFASLLAAGVAALVGVLAAVLVVPMTIANAASTLAQLAEAKGRFFGSATDNPELSDAPYVATLTGGEFDQLTPGNTLKWQTIEPSQGSFNYGPGDTVVNLGLAHNMKVRGHNLVWHSQLAGWVSSLPLNQVQAAMENHITNEVNHYRGKVFAWDVVNEPFNENGSFRADPFFNAMGSAYIADALRTARAADPTVKLYLNDFNIEGSGAKADAMFNLASSLKSQGVPLDGVGFQSHLATQFGFPSGMQANLQRFANLGLEVAITELDVRMVLPEDTAKDATQIQYYTNVVNACLAVSRCVGITLWDYTDKYSWVPSTFSGEGAATPWDMAIKKKADLYNAITTALGGTVSSASPSVSASRSPSPSTSPSPTSTGGGGGTCHIAYSVSSQWSNGFVVGITVGNTSSTALNGWTLKWTFPSGQTISSSWNGHFTQSGSAVTVTNMDYNAAIPAGGNTSIGFVGAYSGTNTSPSSFTLNGTSCT